MKLHNPDLFRQRPAAVLLDLDKTLYAYAPCNVAGMAAAAELAHKLHGIGAADFMQCFSDARAEL